MRRIREPRIQTPPRQKTKEEIAWERMLKGLELRARTGRDRLDPEPRCPACGPLIHAKPVPRRPPKIKGKAFRRKARITAGFILPVTARVTLTVNDIVPRETILDFHAWIAANPPPDLQEWVRVWGGYHNIPWADWDAAYADWNARRLERLGGPTAATREALTEVKARPSRQLRGKSQPQLRG